MPKSPDELKADDIKNKETIKESNKKLKEHVQLIKEQQQRMREESYNQIKDSKNPGEASSAENAKQLDELNQHIDKVIQSGQQGYDNWVAAMSQLVMLYAHVNKVLSKQLTTPVYSWLGGTIASGAMKGAGGLYNYVANKFTKDLPDNLPPVQCTIQLNNDNKLDCKAIHDSMKFSYDLGGKQDFTPTEAHKALLVTSVVEWLDKLPDNYVVKNDKFYKKGIVDDANLLKSDKFIELRDHPEDGLHVFLNKHKNHGVKFTVMDNESASQPGPGKK